MTHTNSVEKRESGSMGYLPAQDSSQEVSLLESLFSLVVPSQSETEKREFVISSPRLIYPKEKEKRVVAKAIQQKVNEIEKIQKRPAVTTPPLCEVVAPLENTSKEVQEKAEEVNTFYRSFCKAVAFSTQAPRNQVVGTTAHAISVISEVAAAPLIVMVGPWSLLLVPLFDECTFRIAIIAGNALSALVESFQRGESFSAVYWEGEEKNLEPFALAVLSSAAGKVAWHLATPYIPAQLNHLVYAGVKATVKVTVAQASAVALTIGSNILSPIYSDPLEPLSFNKAFTTVLSKVGSEYVGAICEESYQIKDWGLVAAELGTSILLYYAVKIGQKSLFGDSKSSEE